MPAAAYSVLHPGAAVASGSLSGMGISLSWMRLPGPPMLSYQVAVLEDEASQREICAILEGGVEAFRQRDKRYRTAMAGRLD